MPEEQKSVRSIIEKAANECSDPRVWIEAFAGAEIRVIILQRKLTTALNELDALREKKVD